MSKKDFFQKVVWQSEKQILVNEILQVGKSMPSVQEIITARVVVKVLDQETLFEKALIQGVTNITILYFATSQAHPIQNLRAQMDFDYFIPIPGIQPNCTVKTDLLVENLHLDLINAQTIETKILFKLLTKVTTPIEDLNYPDIILPPIIKKPETFSGPAPITLISRNKYPSLRNKLRKVNLRRNINERKSQEGS